MTGSDEERLLVECAERRVLDLYVETARLDDALSLAGGSDRLPELLRRSLSRRVVSLVGGMPLLGPALRGIRGALARAKGGV